MKSSVMAAVQVLAVGCIALAGPGAHGAGRSEPTGPLSRGDGPARSEVAPKYDNTFAKDFIMDAPWRVMDAGTPIPLMIVLKDCDTDDIRQLHWIHCWDVTGGGSVILWNHSFGDERIGDDPTEANYWTYITNVTEGHPGLPNGTLLTPANLGYGPGAAIQLKVSIYYKDDIFNYTETRFLRVHVGNGPYPWPVEWYGGDTHYHTMYTNNIAEFGSPIPAVRRAAAAIGLHWITLTDHSCDLDETGDGSWSYATLSWEYTLQTPGGIQTFSRDNTAYGGTWNAILADVTDFGGSDLRLARGTEINLASIDADSRDKTLHALFVNPFYINSPWCGTIGERPVFPNVPDGLAQMDPDGIAYAAHPLSDLGMEFGGMDFAVNGAIWGDSDIATALGYVPFRGLEAFNTRPTRYSTDQNNPWGDFDQGVLPDDPYPGELSRGIIMWDELLRGHLGAPPSIPARKVFLAGGSDAHGDFNYSTYLGIDSYATDNAMGKVQTVVHVPGPFGPGNLPSSDAILDAYGNGRSVVTDGPFLEIGLDRDGDGGWYESGDLEIGDAGSASPNAVLPMRIRWASLTEFGEIVSVRLAGGNAAGTSILFEVDPSALGQGFGGAAVVDLGAFALQGSYYFRAECLTVDGDTGHRAYTNPIWLNFDATVDVSGSAADTGLTLAWTAPNPLRTTAKIRFSLPTSGTVDLTIHDGAGRLVRSVARGMVYPAGSHEVLWDGRDDRGNPAPSNVYLCTLNVNGRRAAQKIQITR